MKKAFASAVLFPLLVGAAKAEPSFSNISPDKLNYFFVQMAHKATLTPDAHQPGTYQLALSIANPYVQYYTKRPAHLTGMLPIDTFLNEWEKSFDQDAPKAGVSGIHADKPISLSLALTEPHYDADKKTLIYKASPLNKPLILADNLDLKEVMVFINDYCASCSGGGF